MTNVCKCGQGAVSAYDGKCGHCRTKRERKALEQKFYRERQAAAEEKRQQEIWRVTRQ